MDDFFDWYYEKGNHKNRNDFEKDFIRYRPKKYKIKIKNYPKAQTIKAKARKKATKKNKK